MHVGESRAFPQGTDPRVVKWDGVKVRPADATGWGGGWCQEMVAGTRGQVAEVWVLC